MQKKNAKMIKNDPAIHCAVKLHAMSEFPNFQISEFPLEIIVHRCHLCMSTVAPRSSHSHTGDFFPYPIFYFIFEDFSDGGFSYMAWKVVPHFGS